MRNYAKYSATFRHTSVAVDMWVSFKAHSLSMNQGGTAD